ncbi:malto-oligosyltrehalose trehalohydrolase [Sanguibacter antarcticus]|uniref:Malto-oligosyltrehalose trehalohydrolase n=1 Tax=Sanguibacter antarcticus TaxID=372484 RepID=A0A2A9E467_9MICO|nr:malto-oligosyltrehalose trehalohydrolase [Sanguibacter antarcticus]PFG32990.1 maltooligosyl trehalose hydrolase [Sanguibacter antarcticus]
MTAAENLSGTRAAVTAALGVWAPRADRVELVLPPAGGAEDVPRTDTVEDRVEMARDVALGDGWWSVPTARAEPLADDALYAFSIDGGPARPDPRSPRQPFGVHGPSQRFDATVHDWDDDAWPGVSVLGSVVYELHVGTFTAEGTFDSAIARLGYLADLGVDLVEVMPVAAFDGRHGWGYDGVDLFAVHEPYGGPAAFQRFVDAAHGHGLGVVLDVVYNHLGPTGNYTSTFGPYFSDDHHTPWGQGINLDGAGSSEVRRWIIDNALRWMRDFHVDALRLDAVHALVDDSTPHILAELSDAVEALSHELGRPLSLVAESDENDPRTVTPTAAGGRGMTAQWADDVHHAVHALLTGERHGYYVDFGPVAVLRKALVGAFVHDGDHSTFRGKAWGHPVPRDTDGHRFVAFASDHDQVGNRARGDRPSDTLDAGGLAMAAALVLTSPFTPMIFMGEEWGASTDWRFFADFTDADLARAVSEGRAREFSGHGWSEMYGDGFVVPDPQDPATRDASVLDWDELDRGEHARLLAWYRTLIDLRRSEPDIASGRLDATQVDGDDDSPVLEVLRGGVRVLLNRGHDTSVVPVTTGSVLLAGWNGARLDAHLDSPPRLHLPPRTVAVVRGAS